VFNVLSLGLGVLVLTEIADSRRAWTTGRLARGFGPDKPPQPQPSLAGDTRVLLAVVLPTLFAGTVAFAALEGWSLPESFYFCLTAASGLGMGDLEPRLPLTRLAFCAYLWLIMGAMLALLGSVGYALRYWIGQFSSPPAGYARAGLPGAAGLIGSTCGAPILSPAAWFKRLFLGRGAIAGTVAKVSGSPAPTPCPSPDSDAVHPFGTRSGDGVHLLAHGHGGGNDDHDSA
jgi:hypothetical protein